MKVCFFGLGSIGRKHLKNLVNISKERKFFLEIHAFRSSNKNKKIENEDEIEIKEIYNINLIDDNYDAIFITNPTIFHYKTLKTIKNKSKNIFIEKPVFDCLNYSIEEFKKFKGIIYVASPLKHSKLIKKIKEIIKKENVYSVRVICSSYLPEWRKEIDYRKCYSAIKELGGGVSIDLIHEWDYISYLFGIPDKVYNIKGKYSNLEINSDDLSIYIAKYQDKLIELHLDYFGRKTKRKIELLTDKEEICADFIKNEIVFSEHIEKNIYLKTEDIYINEMNYFIDLIKRNNNMENINTVEKAFNVLKVALNKGE